MNKDYLDSNINIIEEFAKTNLASGKQKWQDYHIQVDRANELYNGTLKTNRLYQGVANVFLRKTFDIIQTIMIKILKFTGRDWFDIIKPKGVDARIVDGYKQAINDQIRENNFYTEYQKIVMSGLKYRMGIAKVYWKEREFKEIELVDMPKIDEQTGLPMVDPATQGPVLGEKVEQPVVRRVGSPCWRNLDVRNVYLIGNTTNFYDLDGIIEVIPNVDWDTIYGLRMRTEDGENGAQIERGIYFNLDIAVQRQIMDNKIDNLADKQKGNKGPAIGQADKTRRTENTKHTLQEFWCNYDFDGDGKRELGVITLLDGELLIRAQELPACYDWFPYVYFPCLTRDDSIMGTSICDLTEDLNLELNAKRNQMLDDITYALNNMWLRRKGSNITDRSLIQRPNGIIDVNDVTNDLKQLPHNPSLLQAGILADQMIKGDLESNTGKASFPSRPNVLATEISRGAQVEDERTIPIIQNIEQHLLYPFIKIAHKLNSAFIETTLVKVAQGKDTQEVIIKQEDTMYPYDFKIKILSEIDNKITKVQQLQNFIQMMAQHLAPLLPPNIGMPFLLPMMVNIMKRIYILMGNEDAAEVFPTELDQKIQSYIQMQEQQAKMQAQMPQGPPMPGKPGGGLPQPGGQPALPNEAGGPPDAQTQNALMNQLMSGLDQQTGGQAR